MSRFRLEEATITSIHAAYRAGQLTVRELVQGYLKRIEAYDRRGPKINAIVNVNPHALPQADELDQAYARSEEFSGPLHGIPFLVKDQIETTDVRTTFGSSAFKDYFPESDAFAVKKLRDAGTIILAKNSFHNDALNRRKQIMQQARVRNASWMSARRS